MTARSRQLAGGISPVEAPPHQSPKEYASPTHQSQKNNTSPPDMGTLNSDFVVILTALLCALICVLGLLVVARCAWIRRMAGAHDAAAAAANRGVKKKVLNSLPKLTYGGEDGEHAAAKLSDCAICLGDFVAGEEIRVLPQCGHGFHVLCIDTWLGSHSSCPSCRQILGAARCQKCGDLPTATCSAAAAAHPPPLAIRVNRFLP
ncbi:RING-H2 finger protein ATL8-like [Andrographis paniculata]|uniref:RING-H2 finger protein ATL8-like n=1 Tax=Andrographis paniculata TaxID=175694 RepID=UPI0021E8D79F|nr:RING-H2 finger protein ATL8-like [Andrographis paniculata]